MKISFSEYKLPNTGALVVLVLDGGKLSAGAKQVDKNTGGAVKRALANGRFSGKKGQWLDLIAPNGMNVDRVLLAGVGEAKEINAKTLQEIGGGAVQRLQKTGAKVMTVAIEKIPGCRIVVAELAAEIAYGAHLGSYRFEKYRTKMKKDEKASLQSVSVSVSGAAAARRAYKPLAAIADGVFLTRDLVWEPANTLYPESFARECRKLTKLGVKVEVLNEAKMAKLGMGALLGVGQGSVRESQMVVMRWNGAAAKEQPIAFVGKGVCFDTGGISLKPGPGMESMKWDMGGAGTVTGLMAALAGRKAKANVIGVIGLVENMPDGNAQRPGDIVTSMSGQTIEIHNTDAEGRLVLADALWYTQDRFKPKFMIDLATLTGAILVSLGHEYAGLFSNDDELSDRLAKVADVEGEGVWRMPLNDAFDKMINCDGADMKNVGGRFGGSSTAGQFLQRYVNDLPWVHLDIAGMAWSDSGKPTVPKGGTGYGVRLLNRLVADYYEA
jgi:leucyl aminopeptidase